MKLLLLLLIPLMADAMNNADAQAMRKAQDEVHESYWKTFVSMTNMTISVLDYQQTIRNLQKAEEQEKKNASLLTADFYNDLYLNKIMLIVGTAQSYHSKVKDCYDRQSPKIGIVAVGQAKALELIMEELRERIRKKANR